MMAIGVYRGVLLDPPAQSFEEAIRRTDANPSAQVFKERERKQCEDFCDALAAKSPLWEFLLAKHFAVRTN